MQHGHIPRTKKALRAACLNEALFKDTALAWVLKTPYDVRDEAMNDLLKAYATNFAKQRQSGKRHQFTLKYRSRKDETESIVLLHKHYKRPGVFFPSHQFFGEQPIKAAERLPAQLDYDSRLIRTRLGHFYLCIPQPLEVRPENQGPCRSDDHAAVVALDPGVRTFMTSYDPRGLCTEWGRGDFGRIYRLCYTLDALLSRIAQPDVRKRRRYTMRRAAHRLRLRIRNLVDDLHKRLVRWLCENHRVVLLPTFETSQMLRRGQRHIRSKTARAMSTWSHYRFQQRLLHKAREFPWCRVELVCEAHTSKTCGRCGWLHQKLGGNKVYRCGSCGLEADRDVHAARNILLRYLTTRASASLAH